MAATTVIARITNAPAAAGDFTSLATWDADPTYGQRDLTTGDEEQRTRLVNDFPGNILSEQFTLSGWGTSSSNKVFLEAEAGSGHEGVKGAGATISRLVNYGSVLSITMSHVELIGFEVVNTGNQSANAILTSSTNVRGERMMAMAFRAFTCADNTQWEACLAYDSSSLGFRVSNWSIATLSNCSADNCGTGYYRDGANGGSPAARNCWAFGSSSAAFGTGGPAWTGDYNAADDATVPGTNVVTTSLQASDFADYPNDYTPAVAGALDGSGSNAYSPVDAINGVPFGDPPSVGAYEVAGGPPPATVTPDDVETPQEVDGDLILVYTPPSFVVTPNDAETPQTVDGELILVHTPPSFVVNPDDTETPQEVDGDLLLVHNPPSGTITPESVETLQEVDGSLILVHYPPSGTLSPDNAETIQTVDGDLILTHNPPTGTISPDDVETAQEVDGDLVLVFTPPNFSVTPDDVTSYNLLDNITLELPGQFPAQSVESWQTVDNIDLVQHFVPVVLEDVSTSQEVDHIVFSIPSTVMIPDSVETLQSVDNIDLIQYNVLSVDSVEQRQEATSPSIGGVLPGRLVGDFSLQRVLDGTFYLQKE